MVKVKSLSNLFQSGKKFRMLIKHCFLIAKNTVKARQWLEKRNPDSSPSKTTFCRLYTEFKRGFADANNWERSGRSLEAVTP